MTALSIFSFWLAANALVLVVAFLLPEDENGPFRWRDHPPNVWAVAFVAMIVLGVPLVALFVAAYLRARDFVVSIWLVLRIRYMMWKLERAVRRKFGGREANDLVRFMRDTVAMIRGRR